ncbi:MAG TPA: type II toxin-antitoxin system VapC family toxin [Roseiarcus sp.]|nr:type II toxin-antitoxin system VapC family toxin [Roseiarcus sp.]
MKLVIDASVLVKWFVDEPGAERAAAFRSGDLTAPDLILVEVGNALWKHQRSGVLAGADYVDAIEALQAAPITLTPVQDLLPAAARIAGELDHPLYDCVYLALAMREGFPLVTDDQRLLKVAGPRFGRFVRAL